MSFNINTNLWSKRYVYKRLAFLGNRDLSQLGTLVFLAVWHGFYTGYLWAFALEFLAMQAESLLRVLSKRRKKEREKEEKGEKEKEKRKETKRARMQFIDRSMRV